MDYDIAILPVVEEVQRLIIHDIKYHTQNYGVVVDDMYAFP